MTRLLTFFTFSILLLPALSGQVIEYGNDWYQNQASQTWVKLIVDQDGLYRVTKADLQSAGHDLNPVPGNRLRVYYRGQEIPIYVTHTNTNWQYFEFVGYRNDGRIDSLMYRDPITSVHSPDEQPNKNLSLFTDESAYFLTWNSQPSSQRFFGQFDPTYSLYTPVPHFRSRAYVEYHPSNPATRYVQGGGDAFNVFFTLNCDYVTGEGYLGPPFGYGTPYTASVPTPYATDTGLPLEVETRVFGRSRTQHFLRIEMNGEGNNPVLDTTLVTPSVYISTYRREHYPTNPLDDQTDLTFFALRPNTDNNNLSYAAISYDRLPTFDGDSVIRVSGWEGAQKSYFRLQGVSGSDSVYAYDLKNRFRNVGVMVNDQGRVIVQEFSNQRDLLLVTDAGIQTPRIESPSLNRLFDPAGGAEYVIITDRKLSASAEAYAQYRDTASITEVASTKVVYVDEIYDEFGYGSVTPWAIKRFCKYALDNWTVKPQYILLWGKGKYRTREHNDTYPLVPTFGYPATDYEFVCNYRQDSVSYLPLTTIGRVNVQSNTEGFNYLQKVNEYEHTPWEFWMKKGVFLGGGGNPQEQGQIGGAFDHMTKRFTGIPFGGEKIYYQKKTADNVIDPNSATYHDEISEGSVLIHFFGHSTSNIQDVSIREPYEYTNFGRYPMMIAMGCYGGDFTVGQGPQGASFGERWVREKGRGSVAYLGNSSAGYLDPLRDYGRIFYDFMYQNLLGQPIGVVLQTTMEQYVDSLNGINYTNHARQMNLQGDPAVRLYYPKIPDLEINASSIFFTPENFSAQDDSFRISIIVNNLGLVTADSFTTSIRHRLPDGSTYEHPSIRVPMIPFRDTLSLSLINPAGNLLTGQNFFEIQVDSEEEIEEATEQNNFVSKSIVVPGNIPAILSPREYDIVPDNQVTLQASAVFMTQESDIGFIFEIDTASTFDSRAKVKSGTVLGNSTIATWDVPFTLTDSTIYYWRVRLANVSPSVWSSASFRYIATRSGWAQADLPQFPKNTVDRLNLNQIQQRWEFGKFASQYEFVTREQGSFSFSINGGLIADLALSGVFTDAVAFIILDQFTLQPKLVYPVSGPIGYGRVPQELFRLRNAINQAADGDYVIVGSHFDPKVSTWTEDVFEALDKIGVSDNIRQVAPGKSFIVMGRKGFATGATEIYAPSAETKYVLSTILYAPYDQGTVTSTRIGPALDWQSMWWDWSSIDPNPSETMTVSVRAIRNDESDSLVYSGLMDGTTDLSSINAELFPYLQLTARGRDTARRTAPQLDHWHVLFSPAPDIAIDAVTDFGFKADTLVEGQELYLKLGARNLTEIDVNDSLLVRLYIERQDRQRLVIDSLMLPPLAGGQFEGFEFQVSTLNLGLDGLVTAIVEVNPNRDPVEQHYFNNLFSQAVYIYVDRENPLLDVTFDGKHIINGDLVSPEPEIVVEVNDENPFLVLDDTSAFEIYLRTGLSSLNEVRIFLSDPRVDWVPGQLPENKARVYFYPGRIEPLPDGIYTLRVQGRDKRNNASGQGANLYEISFEVVSQSTLTHVLNYPNPFSTSTRFAYTLTGSEMPQMFQIHIYTINGKMVKVVDLLELGDVHFGHNLTNYAWDGTDEYGDRLANGVYLYKVYLRMPSQELELRETGVEDYFRNGWGKMYLMR